MLTVGSSFAANRAVEVSELWRARDKELELDSGLRDRSKDSSRSKSEKHHNGCVEGRLKSRHEKNEKVSASSLKSGQEENDKVSASRLKFRHEENDKVYASLCSSSKLAHEDSYPGEDGMQDEEIEKFLHSRLEDNFSDVIYHTSCNTLVLHSYLIKCFRIL